MKEYVKNDREEIFRRKINVWTNVNIEKRISNIEDLVQIHLSNIQL